MRSKFSLIICTYNRPTALEKLLVSLIDQVVYPHQIIIVDGSINEETEGRIKDLGVPKIEYYRVGAVDRGLTKQRNFGITKVTKESRVICFLDDDVVLTPGYFSNLLETYNEKPEAIGVGGYIIGDVKWERNTNPAYNEIEIDGYKRKLGSRNILRKRLGLLSKAPPGVMPAFSNGLATSFLPPSGVTYPVEFFMGGVASYRKEIFREIRFSPYFKGYGLYEDMDFCLRASNHGQLYVNTAAQLFHYHEESGRPNQFQYGMMVVRNGWYVWRVKYPSPGIKDRLKWHATIVLLSLVRLGNTLNTKRRRQAISETLGRIAGWWSLFFKKPHHEV